MPQMDAMEIGLLLVAAYVSVIALVRLMRRRRDQLISELQQQVSREQTRRRRSGQNDRQREREGESNSKDAA